MKDVDGLLHDHTALDRHITLLDGGLVEGSDGDAALTALADEMSAHMKDEEARLFPRAARVLGETDPGLAALYAQHRLLEELFQAVLDSDRAARKQAFSRFKAAFEKHSLSEADVFSKIWDEMFPGRMMGG